MAKKELTLWQYAVIKQPKEDKDGNVVEEGKVVVDPVTVLAADSDQATLLASRAIPEEEIGNLDRLTVAVRPF